MAHLGKHLGKQHAQQHAQAEAPAGGATRLLWNPFWGHYLGQAPARMQRRELTDACPFCADLTSGRVPSGTQAWIRPNDFPAISPPVGEAHILIYSADHERTFAELDLPDVLRILGLWQQIYRDLAPRYACVMSWETSGEAIGQTQRHPHGQTFALSVLPDLLVRELAAVERAEQEGKGCPFCAELAQESSGARAVLSSPHWLGFIPPYASYPYQVRLTPRTHAPSVADLPADGPVAEELAHHLLRVIRAYHRVFEGTMPYMLALHQLADPRFHFHIELLPTGRAPGKLKLPASSELAWGFWINDSLPEVKAAELREALAATPR
jgi:UDPglucose--hexose-1-phosphate uridylyltransferase